MNRVLAIGALACALTGCGTAQNLTRHGPLPTSYGGVEIAAERFKQGPRNDQSAPILARSVYAADVALSALADTVALPFTLPYDVKAAINAYYFPPPKSPEEQNAWRQFWVNDQPPAPAATSP